MATVSFSSYLKMKRRTKITVGRDSIEKNWSYHFGQAYLSGFCFNINFVLISKNIFEKIYKSRQICRRLVPKLRPCVLKDAVAIDMKTAVNYKMYLFNYNRSVLQSNPKA